MTTPPISTYALIVSEGERDIQLSLGYRTDLFDEPTIVRMLEHFEMLLEGLVADPERRLSELPLLTDRERQQMLLDWNRTEAEFPQHTCLHEMFEAQARRTPTAIAAVCEGRQLTYAQLNKRANRLAHWLRKQGIGPDDLVALHVQRSLDVVVGMLGILKTGGAFLPLDSELPPERVEYMLADAKVRVLITQRSLATGLHRETDPHPSPLPEEAGTVVLCLDTEWEMVAEESDADPPHVATDQNLAYAIYTSGSTGRPKGVMISHRSVVNIVSSFIRSYHLGATDRVLQCASISFDVAINEIFPALCTGATVILPNKDERLDLDGLNQLVRQHGVTITAAAPTALARLNQLPDPLPGVRLILSGGEALSFGEVDRLRQRAEVVNGYGPTEATIVRLPSPCRSMWPTPRPSSPSDDRWPTTRSTSSTRTRTVRPLGVPASCASAAWAWPAGT